MRQNSGRSAQGAATEPPRPPGGTKVPAATVWTDAIVVSGRDTDARASHEVERAGGVCAAGRTHAPTRTTSVTTAATLPGSRPTLKADDLHQRILLDM